MKEVEPSHRASGHQHPPGHFGRAFAIGVLLNLGYVAAEAIWGVLSHSLALLADAGHNVSDVLGLLLSWGASVAARRAPTVHRTYGLRRSSTLAALLNAMLLLVAVGAIAWEAVQRFRRPEPVAGWTVLWVAAAGVVVNAVTAWLFMSGRKGDLNIRAAFVHMAADAGVSAGVVVSGGVMLAKGWPWIDPLISMVIAGVILIGTWGLLRDSVNLALDAVPEGIDAPTVKRYLEALPEVAAVHDLHIWGMSTTETALTAHLVIPGGKPADDFYARAARELHDRFGIEHVTLQVETGDSAHPCRQAPDEVV